MAGTAFIRRLMLAAAMTIVATGAVHVEAQERAAVPVRRTWTTQDGQYRVSATFVEIRDGKVGLRKTDGRTVAVPIELLSEADQEYVEKRTGGITQGFDAARTEEPTSPGGLSGLEQKCGELCEDITRSYDGENAGEKATIAVVEFSNLSGGVTDLGRLLSEELITKLFSTGKYKVIERFLLNKAIAEHKLQWQGVVDPKSAKELGKILGADAVVSGTIADAGAALRVNARLISTETGEVLSVAAATIPKDDAITKLAGSASGGSEPANPDAFAVRKGQPVQLPFREDFSKYKDDETTDWGRGAKVRTGADGRKWLVAATKGQHPVGVDVDLPDNANIEFEYGAEMLESQNRGGDKIFSGITLVDEAGAKYRIEWTIYFSGVIQATNRLPQVLTLPGGASMEAGQWSGYRPGVPSPRQAGTLRIQKRGDTITLISGDEKLTGSVRDFKRFKRFEVDAYRGVNSSLSFTNFKIGKLD